MTAQRTGLAVGALVLLAGLVALFLPLSVPSDDGMTVDCGSAAVSDLSAAHSANNNSVANIPILNEFVEHTDYVAACESELSSRRSWAIPVALLGGVVAIGAVGLSAARTRR